MKRTHIAILLTLTIVLLSLYFRENLSATLQDHLFSNTANQKAQTDESGDASNSTTAAIANQTNDTPKVQQKPISQQECTQFFATQKTAAEIELIKQYQLTNFFRQLEAVKYTQEDIEAIGDMAGLSYKEIKNAQNGFNVNEYLMDRKNEFAIFADNADPSFMQTSEERDIVDNTKNKNYSGLLQAVAQKKLDPKKPYMFNSVLAKIIQQDPNISESNLQQLLIAGFSVNLDTLVYALKNDMPSERIIDLTEHYQGDLTKTWNENDIFNNLTFEAAKHLRPDLVDYFSNKGVPPLLRTSYFDNNTKRSILDVLPLPKTDTELKLATEIGEKALQNGMRPSLISSSSRLKQWLPEKIQSNYNQQLAPNQRISDEMKQNTNSLLAALAKDKQMSETAQDIEDRCENQHQQNKNNYIAEKLKEVKTTEKFSLNDKKVIKKIIQEEREKNALKNMQEEKKGKKIVAKSQTAMRSQNYLYNFQMHLLVKILLSPSV